MAYTFDPKQVWGWTQFSGETDPQQYKNALYSSYLRSQNLPGGTYEANAPGWSDVWNQNKDTTGLASEWQKSPWELKSAQGTSVGNTLVVSQPAMTTPPATTPPATPSIVPNQPRTDIYNKLNQPTVPTTTQPSPPTAATSYPAVSGSSDATVQWNTNTPNSTDAIYTSQTVTYNGQTGHFEKGGIAGGIRFVADNVTDTTTATPTDIATKLSQRAGTVTRPAATVTPPIALTSPQDLAARAAIQNRLNAQQGISDADQLARSAQQKAISTYVPPGTTPTTPTTTTTPTTPTSAAPITPVTPSPTVTGTGIGDLGTGEGWDPTDPSTWTKDPSYTWAQQEVEKQLRRYFEATGRYDSTAYSNALSRAMAEIAANEQESMWNKAQYLESTKYNRATLADQTQWQREYMLSQLGYPATEEISADTLRTGQLASAFIDSAGNYDANAAQAFSDWYAQNVQLLANNQDALRARYGNAMVEALKTLGAQNAQYWAMWSNPSAGIAYAGGQANAMLAAALAKAPAGILDRLAGTQTTTRNDTNTSGPTYDSLGNINTNPISTA